VLPGVHVLSNEVNAASQHAFSHVHPGQARRPDPVVATRSVYRGDEGNDHPGHDIAAEHEFMVLGAGERRCPIRYD
jgi:hypothetical protein